MKPKKAKHNRPNIHVTMNLEENHKKAVERALDFLLVCNSFSFEDAKIERNCAYMAAEKLCTGELDFTRGEIRASAKAIEFAIHCLSDHTKELEEVAVDYPEIVKDVQDNFEILNSLLPDYQNLVSEIKKMK